MRKEIWKDIIGYEGVYKISNIGRVKRLGGSYGCLKDRLMKYGYSTEGYRTVALSKNHQVKYMRINRLVLMIFDRLPKEKEVSMHLNDIKYDNRLENLKWGSYSENALDSVKKGNWGDRGGEKCVLSKLKEEDIYEIRRMRKKGMYQKDIAKNFGVSRMNICHILNGDTWKHI